MSNQQNNPSKNPYRYQVNKGPPPNHTEPKSFAPTNQATSKGPPAPASQKEKQTTPTKPQSGVPTPRQAQYNKPPALDTAANSLACVPTDRFNKMASKPNTPQRPLSTRDKPSSLFNPAVSSTPKSSPIRQPPLVKAQEPPQSTGCLPCTNCQTQPSSANQESNTDDSQLCICPSRSAACLPRNTLNIRHFCVPTELTPTRPGEVLGERILKLEILAISGGRLYDLDKIHEQISSSRSRTPTTVRPTYDPCYDIDRMEALNCAKAVSEGASEVKTLLSEAESCGSKSEKGKPEAEDTMRVEHKMDDTLKPSRSDDKSTLVGDGGSKHSSITHDSLLTGPHVAPRKPSSTESEEHDVLRSAPAAPDPFNLSDQSLADMPSGGEEIHDVLRSAPAVPDPYNLSDLSLADMPLGEEEIHDVLRSAPAVPDPFNLSDLSLADMPLGEEEKHDVLRSAPAVPDPFNLSDLSLTDMPSVGEEITKDGAAGVVPMVDGEQLSLDDHDVALGDVSIPRQESDFDGTGGRKREWDTETDDRRGTGETEKSREADTDGALGTKIGKEQETDTDERADKKLGIGTESDETGREGDEEVDTDEIGEASRRIKREVDENGTGRMNGEADTRDVGKSGREDDADNKTGVDGKGGRQEGETDRDREADKIEIVAKLEETGREAGRAEDADTKLGLMVEPDKGRREASDKREGIQPEADKREEDTKRDEAEGKEYAKRGIQLQSGTQEADRKDGVGREVSAGVVGRTTTVERGQAQADGVTEASRGSFSMILGPSVRNFAHLALSPLASLRTFLGPAPHSRLSHRKRLRQQELLDHPEYVRIKSIRSAFMVTTYEAAAVSFSRFLPRQNRKRGRKTGSTESESSSED